MYYRVLKAWVRKYFMSIIFLFQNETDVHVEIAFVRNKELTKLTVRRRNGIVTKK